MDKEKKRDKHTSVKLRQSTWEAIYMVCINEDRSVSYVIEKAVREFLRLDKKDGK